MNINLRVRQLECCLYWQPKARKQLKTRIHEFFCVHNGLHIESYPEAAGVDITSTMKHVGIELEWPPEEVTYQVVLAGYRIL